MHDHSYFGNGCLKSDIESGSIASKLSCSTRYMPDRYNTETQNIGVFYNFQAATSGTGGGITTDNTNSPDTFCPLGWQLPYGGTGGDYYDKSRSWKYVFDKYGYENDVLSDPNINQYPFDIIKSGHYGWHTGLFYPMDSGLYYSSTILQNNKSYWIYTYTDHCTYRNGLKADGYTLRRVGFLISTHRRHGGRNRCADRQYRYECFA